MEPLVSVVMPVYNAARYLREAIESVLGQTYPWFELIIVDDGSNDSSRAIIHEYDGCDERIIAVLYNENNGTAFACNEGIKRARGKYLCFTAADDVQLPERLSKTVAYLEKNSATDMVFFNYELIDGEGLKQGRTFDFPSFLNNQNALLHQLRRNYMWSGLVTMKRTPDVLFDESLPCSVDYDLFLKLLFKGYRFGYIDEPLIYYRSHGHNLSADASKTRKACQKIFGKLEIDDLIPKLLETNGAMDVLITAAIVEMITDRWEKARGYLLQAVGLPGSQSSFELNFYLGVANYRLAEYEASAEFFEKARLISPKEPTVLNNLAVAMNILGRLSESRSYLEQSLIYCPVYMDARNNLQRLNSTGNLILTERILRGQLTHGDNYRVEDNG